MGGVHGGGSMGGGRGGSMGGVHGGGSMGGAWRVGAWGVGLR